MGIYDDLIPENEKKKKKVTETSYGIYSDLVPKKPSQVASEEVKKKPSVFEKIKTGVSTFVSNLSGKKKIEEQIKSQEATRTPVSVEKVYQEPKVVKPNIFDNQIEYIKTADTSATFSPQAKKKIKEYEDRSVSTETKNWTDRVYEMATTGKDVPFAGDLVEIPETVELLKAADRLKNNKATQQDAILLNDWLQQQNRDTTFGYKVLDVVIGSAKMGAEIYTTAGIYTAGKTAAKKSVKYLMSKAGKEAVEDLVKKKGIKAVATKIGYGLAGEAVRTAALAPLKLPQDVLERQLVSKMETISGIREEEEGIGMSITKGYLDLFTEYASERGGDALGMIAKLDNPVKTKLMKTAIYQTLVKLNPGKESSITKILARAGYDGIVSEMLEERMGEVFRGMLFEVGLSDQEFKLPKSMDDVVAVAEQLAVEAVSFAIPGTISKASDFVKTKLKDVSINTIQLTPDAAIETVSMSDLRGTDAGNTIIAAAYKAREEGNMVLVDLDSKTGNIVLTPKQNQMGVSISEEKIETEAKENTATGTMTSPEALEQMKQNLVAKVSVGKEGETISQIPTTKIGELTDNEIQELKEIAKASTNAKFFSDKIGKSKVAALKATGQSVVGFYNNATREVKDEGQLIESAKKYKSADEFVKAQGEPLYHGTNADFTAFDESKIGTTTDEGMFGRGFYFGNTKSFARIAPRGRLAKNVIEAYPTSRNLFDISKVKTIKEMAELLNMSEDALIQDTNGVIRPIRGQSAQFTSHIKDLGYDGVVVHRGGDAIETVIFDAKNIKTKAQLTNAWKKSKSQKEVVKESIADKPKSIKEIAEETKILEPNIRRILGVGQKEGLFERVDKGVYVLNKDGQDIAYVETGSALESLPRLAKEGFKADMVFLDIPYKTAAVTGGNRGVRYNLISVDQFSKVLDSVSQILRNKDSKLFYMYSKAKSGLRDMMKYNQLLSQKGFKVIAEGNYTKYQLDGVTRVRNMRGNIIEPEGIIMLSKDGKTDIDVNLNFDLIRPKGYQTEKPADMLDALILQGTKVGDMVLDPFSGSGVTIAEAVRLGRNAYGIEISPEAVEGFIKPKLKEAAKSQVKPIKTRGEGAIKKPAVKKEIKPKKITYKPATTDDINNYIDSKKTKFREGEEKDNPETAVILKGATKRLTSKFFEFPDIKNKQFANFDYLVGLANSGSLALKQAEKDIILNLLNTKYADFKTNKEKIDMEKFKNDALDNMMALDIISSHRSQDWADYGSHGLRYYQEDGYVFNSYVLNSPWQHGYTGGIHWTNLYGTMFTPGELEIKEIPVQEGNPTPKFAIVRSGVTLNEANIAENVFTLVDSKKEAEDWIKSRTVENKQEPKPLDTPFYRKGLFSHFRTFDKDHVNTIETNPENKFITRLVEVQSDPYQKIVDKVTDEGLQDTIGVGSQMSRRDLNLAEVQLSLNEWNETLDKSKKALEEHKKTKPETKIWKKQSKIFWETRLIELEHDITNNEAWVHRAERNLKEMEEKYKDIPEMPYDEKLYRGYKNSWWERTIREAISIKATEGFKKFRFADLRTIALVEGFTHERDDYDGEGNDFMPYELPEGYNPHEDLDFGDVITMGGQEMTVVSTDGTYITVAPSDKVFHFDDDDARQEQLDSTWNDQAVYYFEKLEEDWGKIDNSNKALRIKESADILDKLAKFNSKQKDIKKNKESAKEELDTYNLQLKKVQENLVEIEKFIKLLKDGVIGKEKITKDRFDLDSDVLKNNLSYKYGVDRYFWDKLERTYHFVAAGFDGHNATQEERTNWLEGDFKNDIDNLKYEIKTLEGVIADKKLFWSDNLKKIESRNKPSAISLMGIPKKVLDSVKDNEWGFSLDYEVEWLLDKIIDEGVESGIDINDYYDEFIESQSEDYDPDYEGMYDHVYLQEKGYNATEVWTVEGDVEEFYQPSQYDEPEKGGDVETFDVEAFDTPTGQFYKNGKPKKANAYVVLKFYQQQALPYFKKLRKDVKLITDEDGFTWWETELTEADANPPMAYRIKDDFAKAGIKITNKQEKDIIKLNQKFFGDSNIKVVEQILTNSKALGAYHQQMIQILAGQANAKDTFYHEVVHKYLDVFLSREEHIALLKQAQEIYQLEDLAQVEERLAEDFIKYAKAREGVKGKIRRVFDMVTKRIRQYLKNYSKIDKLYDDILSGKAAKPAQSTKEKVTTAKNITQVKAALRSVKKRINDLEDEVNAKIEVAKEMRYGLNTKDIAKLKLVYSNTRKFQEGDIETIRDSKYQELVDKVIEDIQIARPDLSEEEAFDYAMNLPTKAEESFTAPEMNDLLKRKRILDGYLVKLEDKALELANKEKIESSDAVYKEWRNALNAQEQLNKKITVAERIAGIQKPIEETTAEPKLSKVAERVFDKLLDVQKSDISYQPMSIVQDAAKATEFVEQEPDVALKIAKGLELPPPDITETAISIAMAEKARQDGNYLLYTRLILSRSMRQTRRGQEIVAEKARQDENSSEFFIKKLLDERANIVASGKKWLFEKEVTFKKVVDREVKKVKNTIDSAVLRKLESAQKLIDSLTCK